MCLYFKEIFVRTCAKQEGLQAQCVVTFWLQTQGLEAPPWFPLPSFFGPVRRITASPLWQQIKKKSHATSG
jgi:hypothetical protein